MIPDSATADVILPLACAWQITLVEGPPRVVRELAQLTSGQAIVTNRKEGSWAWDREASRVCFQHTFTVENPDSTGCGDAYYAGCIVGLLDGWPLPLRMEFGALIAFRVATAIGGRAALPWRKDLKSLVRREGSSQLRSPIEHPAD
jgi:sugar/nucleoside kinase (ribokinase family)